ncbi:MAG: hypothetical protein JXR25_13480 [Pontiellaceae bacterium]|nr:hypothetical protein [Pontiellaceae bacterium]MBN2785827.1 hypothetical protein [Pontiellaceae bacterium]
MKKRMKNNLIPKYILGTACLMLTMHAVNAQNWKANWVWTSETGPNDQWVNLRKEVSLDAAPTKAVTRIAAENKYWLYVNGVLAVRDGGMELRPDLDNTYYDEIDLAPFLKAGENVIAVLVWHKGGPECYTTRVLENGGFLFQAEMEGSDPGRLVSDSSWKIRKAPGFIRGAFRYKFNANGTVHFSNEEFGGDPSENCNKAGYYRPAGSSGEFIQCAEENGTFTLPTASDVAYGSVGEPMKQWKANKWLAYAVTVDARSCNNAWQEIGFDDSAWDHAIEKGVPPTAPWNKLVNRTIPMWKDFGLKSYANADQLPRTISRDTTIEGKVDVNIHMTPYLKIDAPAGVHVRIILNEFYHQDYITKDGVQEFECFAWQNSCYHKVEYKFSNVTGPVKLLELKYRQTGYNTELIGSFHSDNKALNTLWEKCKNTSYVCMRDFYYDCPNRERGQWWGDVSEQILYSFYLYDQESVKLGRKAYRELMNTQKEDGSLYTTAPGKTFNLPDQNIAAVALLWKYYLYTGDKGLIEELYPNAKKFVEKCASTANDDGMLLLESGEGIWNWIDWGENKDIQSGSANTICNAMYAELLVSMENIANALGKKDDAAYFARLHKKVERNFNKYFWSRDGYVFHRKDGTQSGVIDDRSNAWAVLAGMADDAKKEKILDVLKSRHDASPYQEMYVELGMQELDPAATLTRVETRFSAMIESWSSTLWEEFPAKNSNNHAWSAGPVYLMGAYFLGIRPIKPGFEEFTFMPLMGGLKEIAGDVPCPQGKISASCKLDFDKSCIEQQITVPENTTAIIGIPKKVSGKNVRLDHIEVNAVTLKSNGKFAGAVEGLKFYKENGDFLFLKADPGTYTIISGRDTF